MSNLPLEALLMVDESTNDQDALIDSSNALKKEECLWVRDEEKMLHARGVFDFLISQGHGRKRSEKNEFWDLECD